MPDFIASLDQVLSALPGQAKIIATYRRALLDEGVPPDEVGWLTRDLATDLMFPDRHKDTPPDDGEDD